MHRPEKLDPEAVLAWLNAHRGWGVDAGGALTRSYRFGDYAATIRFVVRLAEVAERHDHHPDLRVRWGVVDVSWWTHDAGGVTGLDLELAELTDGVERAVGQA